MDTPPSSFWVPLRDPWILLSLVLRVAIWSWIAVTGRHFLGDSQTYLSESRLVCSGSWGGAGGHVPLYPWFLCLFSGATIALTLLIQTFVVALAGIVLYRVTLSRKLALLWLLDPVILIYSTMVMTDAFFAVALLASALLFKRTFEPSPKLAHYGLLGLALGTSVLTRSIGMPLALLCLLSFVFLAFRQPGRWRGCALVLVVMSLVIAPRIYWNISRLHTWTLSTQADGWIQAAAGVVENRGLGLTPFECEQKWVHEHATTGGAPADGLRTLLRHPANWMVLSVKGMARLLLGHVNIELAYLATGLHLEGPGWFKETGRKYDFGESLLWLVGVIVVFVYCLGVYCFIARDLWRARYRWDFFSTWCVTATVLLVIVPQLFGDSRFRAPVWALLLALWAWAIQVNSRRRLENP